MLLHAVSDLHIEFQAVDLPKTKADVIILAGDIHLGKKGFDWARERLRDKPVIYVLGNHEYYGHALPKLTDKLKELAKATNVHVLENDKLVIDDVVFLGCTLWTDFKLFGDPRIAGCQASLEMTDYKRIRVSPEFRRLRPTDTASIHWRSRNWLKEELAHSKNKKVVVTHHAPSMRSVAQCHREDIVSAAFASHMDNVVRESGARVWIHGHGHATFDYVIGNTRVVCNPRGYPDEPNSAFIPDLLVEV